MAKTSRKLSTFLNAVTFGGKVATHSKLRLVIAIATRRDSGTRTFVKLSALVTQHVSVCRDISAVFIVLANLPASVRPKSYVLSYSYMRMQEYNSLNLASDEFCGLEHEQHILEWDINPNLELKTTQTGVRDASKILHCISNVHYTDNICSQPESPYIQSSAR